MNSNILLLVLLGSFGIQIAVYRVRILLHPSFWFFIIWILSVLSFDLVTNLELFNIIIYEDILNELFGYIGFTSVCFVLLGLINYKKNKQAFLSWKIKINTKLFARFAIVVFIIALFDFLLNASFDIAANREALLQNDLEISSAGSVGLLRFLLNMILAFNTPLLIISGYFVANYINNKILNNRSYVFTPYYLLPLLTEILRTIGIGGRAGIINALIIIFLGCTIGIFTTKGYYIKKMVFLAKYSALFFLLFSLYSNMVNILRSSKESKNSTAFEERWSEYKYIRPFAGIIEYLMDHYPGYQLRRVDSAEPEPALGKYSLAGVTNLSIPILSQIAGTPLSIQNLLGLETVNTVEISKKSDDEDAEWARTTATVYKNLYDDWGYEGTFMAIAVLVYLTQFVFNRMFRSKHKSISSFFLIYLSVYFWAQSIFSHIIVGNWFANTLYAFWVYDFLNNYYNKRSVLR